MVLGEKMLFPETALYQTQFFSPPMWDRHSCGSSPRPQHCGMKRPQVGSALGLPKGMEVLQAQMLWATHG